MSERGCIKCGYILAGLPSAGTVVSCPECGQANDLSVPLSRRMHWFKPVFWGAIDGALGVVLTLLVAMLGGDSWRTAGVILVVSFLLGGAIAGTLTFGRFEQDPAMGRAPRPLGVRLALSLCAVAASWVITAIIALAVYCALK